MRPAEALAVAFLESHPAEAASELDRAPSEHVAALLANVEPDAAARALQVLAPSVAAAVVARLPAGKRSRALAGMPAAVASLVLRAADEADRTSWLDAAQPEVGRALRAALSHAEGAVGTLMETDVVTLRADLRVDEARRRLRRTGRVGHYVYIVDERGRPLGAVTAGRLVRASANELLGAIMTSPVESVPGHLPVEAVLAHPGWQRLHALPVVDAEGALIGVLRRESYERLRAEREGSASGHTGGLGVALAELAWTAAVSTADELARGLRVPAGTERDGTADGA